MASTYAPSGLPGLNSATGCQTVSTIAARPGRQRRGDLDRMLGAGGAVEAQQRRSCVGHARERS
jgi:hypothetical protein